MWQQIADEAQVLCCGLCVRLYFVLIDEVDLLVDLTQQVQELYGNASDLRVLLQGVECQLQATLEHELLFCALLAQEPLQRQLEDLESFLEVSEQLDEKPENHEDQLWIVAVEATAHGSKDLEEGLLRALRKLLLLEFEQL